MKTLPHLFIILLCSCQLLMAQDEQAKAKQLQKDGNFKDALVIYLELLESESDETAGVLENLKAAKECAGRLSSNEFDIETLRGILTKHPENWQIIPTAVSRAEFISARFRKADEENPTNRFEWLRWYEKAIPFAEKATPAEAKEAGAYWLAFAERVSNRAMEPWKLHSLTDYENPPVEEIQHLHWGDFVAAAAAVDGDGNPLFYEIPESYAVATTNGERWRWLLEKAATATPKLRSEVDFKHAEFLERQFSVITTGERFAPDRAIKKPLYAWHLLADEETVAQLATGASGVRLPAGHRFLELYKGIEESVRTWKMRARTKIVGIYENRGQYSKAAAMLQSEGGCRNAETIKRKAS